LGFFQNSKFSLPTKRQTDIFYVCFLLSFFYIQNKYVDENKWSIRSYGNYWNTMHNGNTKACPFPYSCVSSFLGIWTTPSTTAGIKSNTVWETPWLNRWSENGKIIHGGDQHFRKTIFLLLDYLSGYRECVWLHFSLNFVRIPYESFQNVLHFLEIYFKQFFFFLLYYYKKETLLRIPGCFFNISFFCKQFIFINLLRYKFSSMAKMFLFDCFKRGYWIVIFFAIFMFSFSNQ
jgi:hypothetical protein